MSKDATNKDAILGCAILIVTAVGFFAVLGVATAIGYLDPMFLLFAVAFAAMMLVMAVWTLNE